MTIDEAWEHYQAGRGKNGRPKKAFIEAEQLLISSGELNQQVDASTVKSGEEKKPALLMNIIDNPEEVPHQRRVEIYKEALKYITDKRNYSFRYYLTGQYGLTDDDLDQWELHPDIKRLATIAHDYIEYKCIDGLGDKYSAANPLGVMMILKSVYGYNDKGDSGVLKAEGIINISADIENDDLIDMNYGGEDEE